jgi:hypothetical protein
MFETQKHHLTSPPDNNFMISSLGAAPLYLPGIDTVAEATLLEALFDRRQVSFLAGGLTILEEHSPLATESGFASSFANYQGLPLAQRRMIMEHPCMRIWLSHMRGLPRLDGPDKPDQDRFRALLVDGARLSNMPMASEWSLHRYDVDPLLSAAIPPSYVFDQLDAKRDGDAANPYSLGFARKVIAAALDYVAAVWPQARVCFDRFVKVVVHLPDLESRSCSAARFAGAILLSSADDTLLAVAESLVHECGHQILYCVMEHEPLIRDRGEQVFTLPWSGAQRDAYGYLHATYIYLILAMFFEHAIASDHARREEAIARLRAIVTGLDQALDDFHDAKFFTSAGRAFFDSLSRAGFDVINRNRAFFSN